jgi:uncharacterized membrane protein
MDTSHTEAAATRRVSSGMVTAGIGAVVAVVGIVFAFNATDASSHWFALFKLIHVSVAVFWVGGGLVLTVLALRAERSQKPDDMAAIAGQAAFVGERFFAPAGLIVLAMGITMVINQDISWGTFWVDLGLVGYASTFITGIAFLSPQSKRIAKLIEERGAGAPETQAAIQRILLIARIDVGVLLVVVADMLLKPFS